MDIDWNPAVHILDTLSEGTHSLRELGYMAERGGGMKIGSYRQPITKSSPRYHSHLVRWGVQSRSSEAAKLHPSSSGQLGEKR